VIADPGLPDARDPAARALPVTELPGDAAIYLNGSRYCETDKLGYRMEHLRPSSSRNGDGACDMRLCPRSQSRCTRTALEAYEEKVGVCRDFTHLALTLCRCMNIPARYVNGYLGDSRQSVFSRNSPY
jgi:hypothetical protein